MKSQKTKNLDMIKAGLVSLTGAGPGDTGLLTLKAQKRLQEADCVFYDYLANPELLKFCRPETRLIFVGKRRSQKSFSQQEIHTMMIKASHKGQKVVRLKGGDPLVFGRGGEEALALARAKIPFEIIPGVSSALGAAAYAGIPLTHRDFASEVVFVTGESGHQLSGTDRLAHWNRISQAQTIVIFMGLAHLEENLKYLIQCGRSPQTAAALIHWGTHPEQKKITATLQDLAHLVLQANIQAPSLVIIGEVVKLSAELDWFEKRPLSHQRILMTRPKNSETPLSEKLVDLGAQIFEIPLGEIKYTTPKNLIEAFTKKSPPHWLIMTSVHAIKSLFIAFEKAKVDSRVLKDTKLAVIGSVSADYLLHKGIRADFIAKESTSEGFVSEFLRRCHKKDRILYLKGNLSRGIISDQLKARKMALNEMIVYKNTQLNPSTLAKSELKKFEPSIVVMTSSSAVERLDQIMGGLDKFKSATFVALGKITENSLRDKGVTKIIRAKNASMSELVGAITQLTPSEQ